MICNSCKIEFENINRLKFCPYCGTRIIESAASEAGQIGGKHEYFPLTEQISSKPEEHTVNHYVFSKISDKENKNLDPSYEKTRVLQDTLEIPIVTEKDIKKYNRAKFFNYVREKLFHRKVILPVLTLLIVMAVGAFGYVFLLFKPVDELRIKEDIIGKTIILPRGTSIEIKKDYIKAFSISSRNTSKNEGKDAIKASVILNNGIVEVNTLLSFQYTYKGKNQWEFIDSLEVAGNTSVKPVAAMEEKQFLDELKKYSITVSGVDKVMTDEDIKSIIILERIPKLEESQEEILAEVLIDSSLVAATGKIRARLSFEGEGWKIEGVDRNSDEDFKLALSPAFSQEKVVELIRKQGLDETVSHPEVFGGKGFYVRDSFTRSISIASKSFDEQKGTLTVTAKRENSAGELKTTLSTNYVFAVSFSKIEFLNKSKTTVDSASVAPMTRELVVSTITNVEIEGDSLFFWRSNNHKITSEQAKTFKHNKTLSKKSLQNVKYVYGSITYLENRKEKTASFVALYFLVYDSTKGYSWKLDRIVGEESPNYRNYYPEPR
jgi:hypothetical protein